MKRHLLSCLALMGVAFSGCTLFNVNGDRPLLPEEIHDLQTEAEQLRLQGRQLRERSEFAEALELQTRALDLSLQTGDTLFIVRDYNQLGTTFRRLGRLEQAISYHYQALSYAEACSDTSLTAQKNLVVSLNGLGNAHLTLGNNSLAENCFRRALQGESAIDSHLGMAINYANLGSIFDRAAQYDSARWYYEQSLAQNQIIGSKMGMSLCHVYFGNLYQKHDSLRAAEREFRIAADLMNGNEDRWHAVEPLLALGQNLLLQGRVSEAQAYADEASKVAKELNSFELLLSATRLQADLFERNNKLREALDATKQCTAWEDSLNHRDQDHVIRDLCIRFEQRQTQREMKILQEAYDKNEYMHNIIFWIELALLLASLIVVALLWYASDSRKRRLDAFNALDSMRTTFFRNITHEFRTPLTIILGLTNQLRDETLSRIQHNQFLNSIQQQGNTLLDLVNQLLSYSKLMAGYAQCKWCHGDVVGYLRMTMASYRDFARMRNIELQLVSAQNQIDMDFVPEFYDKILSNLVGNAFKYTSSGGSITVRLESKEDRLFFDVLDTGSGVSPEDKDHIFDVFYQGQNSRMQGSTGIGLPFVKQMVHHLGGIISVRDNMPHGTDMQIIVPTHCNAEGAEIQPWSLQEALAKQENLSVTSNEFTVVNNAVDEHIEDTSLPLLLVVEDNPDVADYISLVLQNHYRVVKACDGYDALSKVGKLLPDAIVTDLMMPGMDGYQLCHSIRQSQVMADVPLIIVSARAEDEDRVRGYVDGADGYLLKPFNPNELIALVSHLLKQRSQTREYMRQLILGQTSVSSHTTELSEDESLDVRAFLKHLHEVVDRQMIAGDMQLETIAVQMNMSRSTLARRIKQIVGTAPSAYILQLRLIRAKQLLQDPNMTISEISLQCGFDDLSYFSRVFRQNFDQTPTQFRLTLAHS